MTHIHKTSFRFVCLSLFALMILASSSASAQNLLSQGWYPQAPAVDANSSDFRFVLEFIKAKTGLGEPTLTAERMDGPGPRNSALAPHVLAFVCKNSGKTVQVDAVLSFINPSAAVVSIEIECGMPVVYPGPYLKPVPPPTPAPALAKPTVLVGDPIANTPGWFQPVPGDDSPDGTPYTDQRGTFVKVVVPNPFGKSVYWKLVQF